MRLFLAKVFRKIQNGENVKGNGFDWGTDNGADLIVECKSGLPVSGLGKTEEVALQVKSYEAEH